MFFIIRASRVAYSCAIVLVGMLLIRPLYNKVENISSTALQNNRIVGLFIICWQNVGDRAKYKGISLTESTPISSRFVMKNDYISLESIRVGYEFPERWLKKVRVSGDIQCIHESDLQDLFLKDERGIDYLLHVRFLFL